MSRETEQLIAAVLESDEDFDTKEVSGDVTLDFLKRYGFQKSKLEPYMWGKRHGDLAVYINDFGDRRFEISFYNKEQGVWKIVSKENVDEAGLVQTLKELGEVPVKESMEDEDFDSKEVYATNYVDDIVRYIDQGILTVDGSIKRFSNHYVHQRTTTFNLTEDWYWGDQVPYEEQQEIELRIGKLLNELEKEIQESLPDWNTKIYRELEQAYEWSVSEEVVAENIEANNYTFDEDGKRDEGDLLYSQLNDAAKQKAREWWVESSLRHGDTYYAEPVVAEWKWLLTSKGFGDVEINWSGFWSQGDGASFTAGSFDLKKFRSFPDPLEFPEQEREQFNESMEGGPRIRGEYWIMDGDVVFADGDIGDMNHEGYARDSAARRVLDAFGADSDEEFIDEQTFSESVIEALNDDGVPANESNWAAVAREYLRKNEDAKMLEACFDCVYGRTEKNLTPDARSVAVQYFGWIWCRGNSFSIWTYDHAKILAAVNGVIDSEDETGDQDWSEVAININIASTGRRVYATVAELQSGRTPGRDPTWPVNESEDDSDFKDILGEPPPAETFTVVSSHGELTVNVEQGQVIKASPHTPGDEDGENLLNIKRFDVDEWRKHWHEELKPNSSLDILDLGYWNRNGTYEPPVEDFRKECLFYGQEGNPVQEAEDEEAQDAKDVYNLNRIPIKNIENRAEYEEYQARVREFFENEGIENLSSEGEPYFSWSHCDCCHRPLGGDRYKATGFNRATQEIQEYQICTDCMYYAEYGQLDDMTMMNIDKNNPIGESDEEDFKDVHGTPPPEPVFTATSSWGTLTVRTDDGVVVAVQLKDPPPAGPEEAGIGLDEIVKFDLGEWRRRYPNRSLKDGDYVDSLDLGFWTRDDHYEPPDEGYREIRQEMGMDDED